MLGQLVGAAVGGGVRRLKARMRMAAAALVALALLAVAFVFCLIAAYLWLSAGPMEPWQAALAVAGALAVAALLILFGIRVLPRRRPPPGEEMAELASAMLDQKAGAKDADAPQVPLLIAAALIGLVIGRRL